MLMIIASRVALFRSQLNQNVLVREDFVLIDA